MKNNQAEIYDALVLLSVVLNQPQDPKRLMFYAEALKDFDLNTVLVRIRGFSTTTKYFPQLVEIIEQLRGLDAPADELATIIASEIIECISKFGPYQINEVKKHLGEKYQIVERSGGWNSLCQITYSEVPSTRAQLRELAKAYINRTKREMREDLSIDFSLDTKPVEIGERKQESSLRLVKFD